MPEAILNTSPLQYLFQTDLLDLLPKLYSDVAVPEAVSKEVDAGRSFGISLPVLSELEWLEVRQVERPALLALAADLGPGEREVLALAVESPEAIAILDDALARRSARVTRGSLHRYVGRTAQGPGGTSCAPSNPGA